MIKGIVLPLMSCFLVLMIGADCRAQSIVIDRIEADKSITGHVSELSPAKYPSCKVIVYVHTDQWYIHPFAGQGEGASWASILDNGTWHLQTVRREFKADRVAALVVNRDYSEPSKVENIEAIPYVAETTKDLRNTPDEGKL